MYTQNGFYDTHMYGEKMTDATLCTHNFQHQDFAGTLNQALGRSDIARPVDNHDRYPDFCREPYFSRTGRTDHKTDHKTDALYSDALDIDRELAHLVQNNMAYSTTTERLLQKMVLFTHAIDQKGN